MQENKEIQHTITINKISQANSHKDIEDSIKIFLQTAKKNKRNIKIITPPTLSQRDCIKILMNIWILAI